jgi:PhnB protein
MASVNVYLNFNGNCLEVFEFYKSVFGGEFAYLGKFKDMPPMGEQELTPEDGERIMHVSLPISKETNLMGSDTVDGQGPPWLQGNNFSISVTTANNEEADKIFKDLSPGGHVIMPMADMFWGSYFGMLVDQFGINWMVSHEQQQQKS